MGHLSGPVNVPVKNGELDEVVWTRCLVECAAIAGAADASRAPTVSRAMNADENLVRIEDMDGLLLAAGLSRRDPWLCDPASRRVCLCLERVCRRSLYLLS
jgi:hypothetical protein